MKTMAQFSENSFPEDDGSIEEDEALGEAQEQAEEPGPLQESLLNEESSVSASGETTEQEIIEQSEGGQPESGSLSGEEPDAENNLIIDQTQVLVPDSGMEEQGSGEEGESVGETQTEAGFSGEEGAPLPVFAEDSA